MQARGELTGKDLEKTFLSDRTFLWGFGYKTISLGNTYTLYLISANFAIYSYILGENLK